MLLLSEIIKLSGVGNKFWIAPTGKIWMVPSEHEVTASKILKIKSIAKLAGDLIDEPYLALIEMGWLRGGYQKGHEFYIEWNSDAELSKGITQKQRDSLVDVIMQAGDFDDYQFDDAASNSSFQDEMEDAIYFVDKRMK
jgi:hypothetical protein